MKKSFMFFVSLLLVIVVSACSSKPSTTTSSVTNAPSQSTNAVSTNSNESVKKEEVVTLNFLERWPNEPYKKYFKDVIDAFEKENPKIKINTIAALNDDYKQKSNVLLNSDNPPDIFFSWVGEWGEKFVREGVAMDITNLVNGDKPWKDQIIESQFGPFTSGGKIYGVPFYMDGKLFYYNTEIFTKYNLKAPKTWTEFIHVLQVLKDNGQTPIYLGNKSPWAGGHFLTTMNQRIVSPEVHKQDYTVGASQFTDPGYTEALKKIQELIPYLNKNPNALSHEEVRNIFISGKVPIIYLETLEASFVKDTKFEWNIFNFPAVEGGKGDQNELTGAPEGFMIHSKTKHPEEAMKFLKFMISKQNGELLVKETGLASVVKGTMTDANSTKKEQGINELVANASNMTLWIDTALPADIFTPYIGGLQELIAGKKTPEQLMKEVQDAALKIKK